jgi:hypothetical protein
MNFKEQPHFRYDPLDQSKDSFRLCKILPGEYQTPVECELVHDQISAQSDLYHALSYAWGKTKESRWIRLNGKPFHLQPSLFAALKAIRKADAELVVWADAICIDQRMVPERNHQVSQMGNIYRHAKEVLAWLGPAAGDSDMLMDYISRHFVNPNDMEGDGKPLEFPKASDEDQQRASRALSVFNQRDYWRRAWIIQEIILAKELTIYCGSKTLDGFRLFLMASLDTALGRSRERSISNLFYHREKVRRGVSETLQNLLIQYSQTDCKDPRDRVFSLLTLASDCYGNEEMFIDYTVDTPTMFFALLAWIKPAHIIKLVATLQNVLEVPTSRLLEFWLQVSPNDEAPKTNNHLEELALLFVQAAKNMLNSPKFSAWKELSHAKEPEARSIVNSSSMTEWLMRCCMHADSETQLAEDMVIEFESRDFCVLARPTLFGLIFQGVYEKVQDPQSDSDIKEEGSWQLYHRSIEEELSKEPSILTGNVLETFNHAREDGYDIFGALAWALACNELHGWSQKHPITLACSYLIEKNQRSPRGICMAECRMDVKELFGHRLLEAKGG